jgi:hypothetical protein
MRRTVTACSSISRVGAILPPRCRSIARAFPPISYCFVFIRTIGDIFFALGRIIPCNRSAKGRAGVSGASPDGPSPRPANIVTDELEIEPLPENSPALRRWLKRPTNQTESAGTTEHGEWPKISFVPQGISLVWLKR